MSSDTWTLPRLIGCLDDCYVVVLNIGNKYITKSSEKLLYFE